MRTEQWQRIHALHAELASVRAVATYLGLHRRTVREALRSDRPPRQTPAARGSLIDPYRGWLLAKLEQ
jgi:transposase